MACPVDGTTLVMSERSGIEIDYCPTCRGVWLDRGELDKIIERNAASQAPQAAAPQPAGSPQQAPWGQQQPGNYGHGYGHKPYKRRKSFLEELFD
jgi:Zn-finger nucleic acid-binding protein